MFVSSFTTFFPKSSYNLDVDLLVHSFVGLGVANTVCLGSTSGVGLDFEILCGCFVGKILLLKLLIFSLAIRSNPALFKKDLFSTDILP